MEINKIFDNTNIEGVADNLFSSVKNSVSEVKAMQQRKAAENVQLVIQALKKIESDLQDKFDGVTTVLEKRVSTIKDGRDGANGRDGRDGKDGKDGRQGRDGARGFDGLPGQDGADGQDGVSVVDARIDFDGSLVIGLSSGREINVGEVVAPDLAERIKVITNGGGTSQGVLDTLASLQAQITAIQSLGAVNYRGTWNASTNTPAITGGSGTKGYYYVVSVAGSTSIDGQTLWGVGDWIIYNGTAWQKVDGGSTGDFTNIVASGSLTLSAGTANGVGYLNASKMLTSGPALTWNGATFKIGDGTGSAQAHLNGNGFDLLLGGVGGTVFGYGDGDISLVVGTQAVPLGIGTSANQPVIFGVNNTEQMRLTATGLGIGTSSPGAKLDVNGGTNSEMRVTTSGSGYLQVGQFTNGAYIGTSSTDATAGVLRLGTGGTTRATIDTSGNLGLGVVPSASSGGGNFNLSGDILGGSAVTLGTNWYFNGGFKYKATGTASRLYLDSSGGFSWFTAPSGTAGDPISFTQAMTLDANGNLGIGTTSPSTKLHTSAYAAISATIDRVGDYGQSVQLVRNGISGNAGLGLAEQNQLGFYTNSTEQMRLTSTGLGIGTSSPLLSAAGRGNLTVNGSTDSIVAFGNGGTNSSYIYSASNRLEFDAASTRWMQFNTNGNERMRLDSSGNLLIGRTTAPVTNTAGVGIQNNGLIIAESAQTQGGLWVNRITSDGNAVYFTRNNALVGTISVTGSATTYNTSSDYRLKNITGPITTSGSYIDSLSPVEGTWKADGSTFVGLIAHEVQEASRTQVATGVKDGEQMQGMDYSSAELIANMLAELKSLRLRVLALEGTSNSNT